MPRALALAGVLAAAACGTRQDCEWHAGTWGAPCPEGGRVGTCTCTGSRGISTVVHHDAPIWTADEASASCAELGCDGTAP